MGEDLELLDGVRRRAEHEARVESVVVGGAVEKEVVRLVALTIDVEARGGGAKAVGARLRVAVLAAQARRRRHHAGNQGPELGEVPAIEREIDDLLLIDDDAESRVAGFDQRRFARDLDGFTLTAYLHRDVDERRLRDVDLDSASAEGRKTGQAGLHVVGARLHQLDGEETVRASGRGSRVVRRGVRGFDGHAGKDRARLVLRRAGDRTGGLRMSEAWGQAQETTKCKDEPCPNGKLSHIRDSSVLRFGESARRVTTMLRGLRLRDLCCQTIV